MCAAHPLMRDLFEPAVFELLIEARSSEPPSVLHRAARESQCGNSPASSDGSSHGNSAVVKTYIADTATAAAGGRLRVAVARVRGRKGMNGDNGNEKQPSRARCLRNR